MDRRGSNTLPGRGFPQVTGVPTPGLPQRVAGGANGPVSVPSREALPLGYAWGGMVPGGAQGAVGIPRRATWMIPGRTIRVLDDALVPVEIGDQSMHWNRFGITWLRGMWGNVAGRNQFIPINPVRPNWTANAPDGAAQRPLSEIPVSVKFRSFGGLRKGYGTDRQFFPWYGQPIRWPIQKPVPLRIRQAQAQARTTNPSPNLLTRFLAARSYGAGTVTLQGANLTNVVGSHDGGGTYGAY